MTESGSENLRLFAAISLPEAIKAEVAAVQTKLRRACEHPALRWTPREQWHLTLKFLGAVPSSRLAALTESLAEACAGCRPLILRAEGIGFFPPRGTPRVVWVGVSDREKHLEELQRVIETASVPFTKEEPTKSFTGHVTLARAKELNGPAARKLRATVENLAGTGGCGEWRCAEVELMRSELSAAGARHGCLSRLPLLKI
jgi:2'-5' RNA ligase